MVKLTAGSGLGGATTPDSARRNMPHGPNGRAERTCQAARPPPVVRRPRELTAAAKDTGNRGPNVGGAWQDAETTVGH